MSYRDEVRADNPAVYYRLGEITGTLFKDETAFNDTAESFNSPTLDQPGAISDGNRAVRFIRASNTFIREVIEGTNLDLGDIFTIEAWVKLSSLGQGTFRAIASKGQDAFYMRVDDTDKIQLIRSGVENICTSTIAILDTQYHHIVCTKNGSSVFIYIDGVDRTGTVTSTICGINNNRFQVGADADGAEATREWSNDTIDEVAVYPTVLSASRILAHYRAASAIQVSFARPVTGRGAC